MYQVDIRKNSQYHLGNGGYYKVFLFTRTATIFIINKNLTVKYHALRGTDSTQTSGLRRKDHKEVVNLSLLQYLATQNFKHEENKSKEKSFNLVFSLLTEHFNVYSLFKKHYHYSKTGATLLRVLI
jgi:hypothetical protein